MLTDRLMQSIHKYFKSIYDKLSMSQGSRGQVFFIDNNDGRFSLANESAVTSLSLIDNDDDLGYVKATLQSNQFIFNNWMKISRGYWPMTDGGVTRESKGFSDLSIPSEVNSFTYDSENDRITNPVDTYSMVGFINSDSYDYYVLDVDIGAFDTNQNDPIGLLVGYARDEQGQTHTLVVFRSPYYSHSDAFEIQLDSFTINHTTIMKTRKGLVWGNGMPADTTSSPRWSGSSNNPEGNKNWTEFGEVGCRIRVTREDNQFTFETSNFGSRELVTSSTLNLNLNDYPELSIFKGPSPSGYVAISQDNATWQATQRPGKLPTVVDIRTGEKHIWDGKQWKITKHNLMSLIRPGRMYFNPVNHKLFYTDLAGIVRQLSNEI